MIVTTLLPICNFPPKADGFGSSSSTTSTSMSEILDFVDRESIFVELFIIAPLTLLAIPLLVYFRKKYFLFSPFLGNIKLSLFKNCSILKFIKKCRFNGGVIM